MDRIPEVSMELNNLAGSVVSLKALEGRGYIHLVDGAIEHLHFPNFTDFGIKPLIESDDDSDITYLSVFEYLADRQGDYEFEEADLWIKCLAAQPQDVDNQEVYMVICLKVTQQEDGCRIDHISVFARMVEQMGGGWFYIPGSSTVMSHFFEMEMVPPEVRAELNNLINGRYIPEGFTLIGKPMPEDLEAFHQNPRYSAASNSGLRNVYWHNQITLDEDELIKDMEISTYEREISMCQRPNLMDSDYYDCIEAMLYIIDCYTESEWEVINP